MGIVIYSMFCFFMHYKNNIVKNVAADPCADPESFVRGAPTLTAFFLMRRKRIKIPLKSGNHRPASEMPFKWRLAGVPMMTQH